MRTKLSALSNEDLLSNLHAVIGQGRVLLARLLAYLGEVEERRLDLESACVSLSDFCIRRLRLSEDEAYRRATAARLGRRFPLALEMIEAGTLHLTTLLMLRDFLTEKNHRALLCAVAGKTKNEVREVIAARFPRPDLPSLIRAVATSSQAEWTATCSHPEHAGPPAKPGRVEPLAAERYGVQFTASAELKQKIERATNLMRHRNPSGDLSVVMEHAIDSLLAQLENQRLGKTKQSRANTPRRETRPGYVPRAVRREVFERDREQCTFVDTFGRRCESRAFLELDHINPRARGGRDDADNLCVKCRRHNGLAAEHAFGREHIERRKTERKARSRQRVHGGEMGPRQRVREDEFDPRQRVQEDETVPQHYEDEREPRQRDKEDEIASHQSVREDESDPRQHHEDEFDPRQRVQESGTAPRHRDKRTR